MTVKVLYHGWVIEASYTPSEIKAITAISGKDILESSDEYVLESWVKIKKTGTYLMVITTDGTKHLFSDDCAVEFIKEGK